MCLAAVIFRFRLAQSSVDHVKGALVLSVVALVILKLIARPVFGTGPASFYTQTHWQFDFFFVGIALRLYYERRRAVGGTRLYCSDQFIATTNFVLMFLAAYLALAMVIGTQPGDFGRTEVAASNFMPFQMILALIFALILVTGTAWGPDGLKAIMGFRPLRWLAGISYSMYIVHMVAINWTTTVWLASPFRNMEWVYFSVIILLNLAVTVGLALVMYVAVERPAMMLRKRVEQWLQR
jgi:peptidoglycan/LPS O-acetylase OafA/YrhL